MYKIPIFIIAFLLGCNSPSKEKVIEKSNLKNSPIKFRFFSRGSGSNNYYYTNKDDLVIEKFNPNDIHLAQLVELAVNYRDTAKAENPISAIKFFGEKNGEYFDLEENREEEFYDYIFLTVWFENSPEINKNKKHPSISGLTLWKNKLSADFEGASMDSLIKQNPNFERLFETVKFKF